MVKFSLHGDQLLYSIVASLDQLIFLLSKSSLTLSEFDMRRLTTGDVVFEAAAIKLSTAIRTKHPLGS